MRFVADLHFHSKYSRAVSPKMDLENLSRWGARKGIDILTATDFTHPVWSLELKSKLKEVRPGVYQLKAGEKSVKFILTTEIALIYPQHRVHIIVLSPSIETVEKINQKLGGRFNLASDGRPILGINSRDFVEMLKSVDKNIEFIPAHIWTPWFALYGSKSGYEKIADCFGDMTGEIKAIETGLSSDPLMNWQIEELDNITITSFSDSHSLENLGRNATIFELPKEFTYQDIIKALSKPYSQNNKADTARVAFTLEFYPEEGKYHYTGHRKCNVRQTPEETVRLGSTCSVCGKPLTIGVMHQVKKLSRQNWIKPEIKTIDGSRVVSHPQGKHHPFSSLVPLQEIIAEVEGVSKKSKRVQEKYFSMLENIGTEIDLLCKTPISQISGLVGERIAEGVEKNRQGDIFIDPGYDGVYGKVKIWPEDEEDKTEVSDQMSLL